MQNADFLAALARDGAAFADSCEAAGLDGAVPACPDWRVADLVWHLLEVHHFWRTVVGDALIDPRVYQDPERPADSDLLAAYREGLAATVAVLTAADPAQENWTWTTDHTAGWVVRRMAQETAVHLVDAQAAAGQPLAVEPALASDGIDEFLQWFADSPWAGDGAASVGGSVHLHCTDVPGEWLVVPGGPDGARFTVTREHAKGDAALRGAAGDLLLTLWRRVPISAVDVVGDAGVAERFVAATSLN